MKSSSIPFYVLRAINVQDAPMTLNTPVSINDLLTLPDELVAQLSKGMQKMVANVRRLNGVSRVS